MSNTSRCPFTVEGHSDEKKKDTITFKKRIDPEDPDSLKLLYEVVICADTEPESILKHDQQFSKLQVELDLDSIIKRKSFYVATLSPTLKEHWRSTCQEAPLNFDYATLTIAQFNEAREYFIMKFMPRSTAADTRKWLLYSVREPRQMSVHHFVDRIHEICALFAYMPRPRPNQPRMRPLDEEDKISILHSACSPAWQEHQIRMNQDDLDLNGLIRYYASLKTLEDGRRGTENGSSFSENKKSNNKNNGKNRRSSGSSDNTICPIHGNHLMRECRLIKQQREEFQATSKRSSRNRNQNDNNNRSRQRSNRNNNRSPSSNSSSNRSSRFSRSSNQRYNNSNSSNSNRSSSSNSNESTNEVNEYSDTEEVEVIRN